MPHIQILPAIPSFGEKVADTLSKSLGQIGSAAVQHRNQVKARENDQRVFQEYMNDPHQSPMKAIHYHSQLSREGQTASEPLFKAAITASSKPNLFSPSEKIFDQKRAETINKFVEHAPKIDQISGTIEHIKSLSKDLSSLSSPFTINPFGKKETAFDTAGFTALQPIIEIFNPRGVIPQRKIEMLTAKYAPRWWESRGTREAKIEELERLNDKAKGHQEKFRKLAQKYGGFDQIPYNDLANLMTEGEHIIDDAVAGKGKSSRASSAMSAEHGEERFRAGETVGKLPPASGAKGAIFKDSNGNRFISDGKSWKKVA